MDAGDRDRAPGPAAAAGGDPAGLEIRGGPGGVTARLDDLDQAGARLQQAAIRMGEVAVRAARAAARTWGSCGALTVPASPGTWLAAQRRLTLAVITVPDGAVAVAARLAGLAAALHAVTGLYRAADTTVAAVVRGVDVAVGRAVGRLVASPVVTAVLVDPVPVLLAPVATGHPGLVEHGVVALPAAIDSFLDSVPPLAVLAAAATATPAVPADIPSAAAWLCRLGARGPWLRETGEIRVTARRAVAARPPQGVGDLLGGVAGLDPTLGSPPGTVRVVARTGRDGRRSWIVQIPGTQTWSPRAGRNPLDLTGNLSGMAGMPTAARRLVAAALREAGAVPGEPVLLAGHSQGGLVAAQLAADPAFRSSFTVTHVVTAGAPIASVPVPPTVSVLALEHDEDVVPRLDGGRNPDLPRWITVSRPVSSGGDPPGATPAHDVDAYRRTGEIVDTARDPGLTRWRARLEPFLAAPGASARALEVTGERVVRGP